MTDETTAELFIRVLVEELQTDRARRTRTFADRSKAFVARYRKRPKYGPGKMDPPDCVQLMTDQHGDLQTL